MLKTFKNWYLLACLILWHGCWVSDDPEDAQYITLEEKTTVMIFSLWQDLIYVANNWRVQTPKYLALAVISF